MSVTNTTKMANRYGLNLKLTDLADADGATTATIDFANEVSLEITGDYVWATGGQAHSKMVGFKEPLEGTLKISTQIVTAQLMQIVSGGDLDATGTKASFKDDAEAKMKYYKIVGETVWKDPDGTVYNETITAYKCAPKPNYSATYNGSGDPISLDIEFELIPDASGNFLDIERADQTTSG